MNGNKTDSASTIPSSLTAEAFKNRGILVLPPSTVENSKQRGRSIRPLILRQARLLAANSQLASSNNDSAASTWTALASQPSLYCVQNMGQDSCKFCQRGTDSPSQYRPDSEY